MTSERKPVAFGDLRGWIAGARRRRRIGTHRRRGRLEHRARHHCAPGAGRRHRTGAVVQQYPRLRRQCPLPAGFHRRAIQRAARRHDAGPAARHPSARTGQARPHRSDRKACRRKSSRPARSKENIVKGDDIDLYEFPVPQWNRADGGRYIMTYGGVVTKDPLQRRHECRYLSRHDRRLRIAFRS